MYVRAVQLRALRVADPRFRNRFKADVGKYLVSIYSPVEPLDIEPLYRGARWTQLSELGPLLVAIQGSPRLIHDTWQGAARRADASLLDSPAPMISVAEHLRRFIAPSDVLGSKGLLRFADPLVTRY